MKKFLNEVASKKSAPGGGSASALAGALAAALVNKVCLLTIGKGKYREVEEQFKQLNKEIVKLQKDLFILVDKDMRAYQAVVKTKGGQAATKKAAEVPLETAQKSLEVLKRAIYASEYGNQNLRSDAFCAIELATAAVYGALENVRANLPFIKDEKYLVELKNKIDEILNGAKTLVKP
ncbi:MAG TPA: cyclodeaminase/cyclohydrolase family protein [Patescibacteria group bacterium]|nr:cyclodeaminase/cyclohydrolase family protein [Patescibacteria group bacterium]